MRPMMIDTDTASDDAVALIMALRDVAVDVRGLTIVSGNVPVGQGALNARYCLELCGRGEVPIHVGAAAPLQRAVLHAKYFHGEDGLGDAGFAPREFAADPKPAVEAILDCARQFAGDLELVTLGPLTNVALAV